MCCIVGEDSEKLIDHYSRPLHKWPRVALPGFAFFMIATQCRIFLENLAILFVHKKILKTSTLCRKFAFFLQRTQNHEKIAETSRKATRKIDRDTVSRQEKLRNLDRDAVSRSENSQKIDRDTVSRSGRSQSTEACCAIVGVLPLVWMCLVSVAVSHW